MSYAHSYEYPVKEFDGVGVYLDDVTGNLEVRNAQGYGLYLDVEHATVVGEALLLGASKSAKLKELRVATSIKHQNLDANLEKSAAELLGWDAPQ